MANAWRAPGMPPVTGTRRASRAARDWRDVVCASQTAWLRTRRARFDERGYTRTVEANLFVLSAEARAELAGGDGDELGRAERTGKITAPWSSSALAVNVFEHWRGRDLAPLLAAIGVSTSATRLRLEAKFPTGFSSRHANLDVALDSPGGDLVAIESKFLEPYAGGARGTVKKTFSATYFARAKEQHWGRLRGLRVLATDIAAGRQQFRRLDAPQLIKHAIALHGTGRPFTLVHLWYGPPAGHPAAGQMAAEVDAFRAVAARDGLEVRSLTYQELFARLRDHAGRRHAHAAYVAYVTERYATPPLAPGPAR